MSRQDRILIVDDNPTNIAILEEILEDTYQLSTATSGEEALAIIPDFRPDLILLDIMMPGIDGYETCRRIRANPDLHHTKIIMVSAKAMMSERLQGYEAGADDYVTKPFEEEELLAKVRVYLRLKSVEEVDRLKSEVLTLLGHETCTPLSTIITPVKILMSEDDMSAEERTMLLDMVQQSAKRLQRIFEQVLSLSQMKSGKWAFELVPANLNDVVRSAVSTVSPQALQKQVQIELELPEDATTMLDLQQMSGVIRTLLENAVCFSPVEGRVALRVVHDNDALLMTVADQGDGIEPDMLTHVFDEFVHTELSYHTKGLGLSLAIARQVVLAHNGTIEVASAPGAGATFSVRLPLSESADGHFESLNAETFQE